MTDCAGNVISQTPIEFVKGRPPRPYELIISEVMANPQNSTTEYVEIYKATTEVLSLNDLVLSDLVKASYLKNQNLFPGEYLVLTAHSAVDQFSLAMGLSNWPNINNERETLSLFNSSNQEIFRLTFDETWYRSKEKAEGGHSLEMIDLNYPCVESYNWTSSHQVGGTPGDVNSANASNPDLFGPKLLNGVQLDEGSIELHFSEKLNTDNIVLQYFEIDKNMGFIDFRIGANEKSIVLYTNKDLAPNSVYTLPHILQ